MSTRNPVDPQNPRAAGAAHLAAKQRRRRQPLGTRAANKHSVPGKDRKSVEASALMAVGNFDDKSKVIPKATECIEYKGYELKIEPHRAGWKAAIFPKGSPFALHQMPYSTQVAGRDVVVEQAKAIVDEATADKTLPMVAIEPAESPGDWSLTLAAFSLRFQRSLLQGWATLKRAYYSVDQTQRTGS